MVGDGSGLPVVSATGIERKGTVRGPSLLQVPLLASGALGIQTVWSVEMAFATPYLIQLGLSKSMVSAVFVAGPLSGLIVQPAIGVLSDNSAHRLGRRRPMLAAACLFCSASMLLLGFARPIAGLFGAGIDSLLPKLLAVISIFGIDFSVNAVSALNRALVIDLLPATNEAQSHGNAWISRLAGVGSIASFLLGNLDLPHSAPFSWFSLFAINENTPGSLEDAKSMAGSEAQLRCLSALTVFVLLTTNALVAWVAQEVPLTRTSSAHGRPRWQLSAMFQSCFSMVSELVAETRLLHPALKDLLRIQFFAQIGWFPVLFYSTLWLSGIYKAAVSATSSASGSAGDIDLAATREGSLAMFCHAVVVLLASIALPAAYAASESARKTAAAPYSRVLTHVPDLPGMWAASHFVFAGSMLLTWPAAWWNSVRLAFIVASLTGLPWAVNVWAPYTLIGIILNVADNSATASQQSSYAMTSSENQQDEQEGLLHTADVHEERIEMQDGRKSSDTDDLVEEQLRLHRAEAPTLQPLASSLHTSGADKAATVLGIHNVAIVLPQFVVTIISSLVFALLEPNLQAVVAHDSTPSVSPHSASQGRSSRDAEGAAGSSDAVGVVLRIGGVSAIVAGVLTMRFKARYRGLLRGERMP